MISGFTFFSSKESFQLMKSSNKWLSLAHDFLTMPTFNSFAKSSIVMHHFNQTYWTSNFQRRSKLCYVVSYRSVSSNYKSDSKLVNKDQEKWNFVTIKQKLLPGSTICETRQIYLKKKTKFFLDLFNYKSNKASKKVQENFTYDKVYCMFISLELILKNQSQNGYYKYNLFKFLCNPCFLLYCYIHVRCHEYCLLLLFYYNHLLLSKV